MRDSRAVPVASVAYVIGWAAHMTLPYYLAPIALREGGNTTLEPWVFAAVSIASLLAVAQAGRLADSYPRRRVMRAGLALLAVSFVPLLVQPRGLVPALLGASLSGAGLATMIVSFNSYVADMVAGPSRSKAYGSIGAFSTLAGAVGPFAAAGIFRVIEHDQTAIRAAAAIFCVACVAAIILTLTLPPAPTRERSPGAGVFATWRAESRHIKPVAIFYAMLGIGYGMTFPYFAVYFFDTLHTPYATWGVLLGVATVASALGAFAGGRLVARYSMSTIVLSSQTLLLASMIIFVLPLPFVFFALGYVGRNVVSNMIGPILNSSMMGRVATEHRARTQAWMTFSWNVGWTVGSLAGGVVLARWGGWLFPLGGVIGFVSAAIWLRGDRA